MRLRIYILITLLSIAPSAFMQTGSQDFAYDDPVLAQMDSLDVLNFFKHHNFTDDVNKLNIYNYPKDSIPAFTDDIYRDRMSKLDRETPFNLDYNDEIKRYIELYAFKRRGTVSRCLGLAELYFPLFEQKLVEHKMPLELKYLSIVESALKPNARSRVGAGGLWQFMPATGKMYGLRITSYIDERCDPEKSTIAACKYLKYLYKYFGNDWQLALAAYNCGPGNVNKAIRRSGGKKTFWEIRPYLPRETAAYVPAFIAVNYIMAYHKEHNIYPKTPKYFHYEVDSIWVNKEVKFSVVSQFTNVPVEDLRILNPMFLLDVIPEGDAGYPLYIPKTAIGEFLANEENIYTYSNPESVPVADENSDEPINNDPNASYKIVEHKVKKGEYLSIIAKNYNVTVDSIKIWNKLNTEVLFIDQVLKLHVAKDFKQNSNVASNQAPSNKYHVIKSGDTLWGLAQKYHTTVDNLRKWNKLSNGRTIYVGMKLIVKKG